MTTDTKALAEQLLKSAKESGGRSRRFFMTEDYEVSWNVGGDLVHLKWADLQEICEAYLALLEENERLREALEFYRDDGLCQHCEGDCDEPHTDNDVCGPAACSVCGGHGRDTGQKAAQALANHDQESE